MELADLLASVGSDPSTSGKRKERPAQSQRAEGKRKKKKKRKAKTGSGGGAEARAVAVPASASRGGEPLSSLQQKMRGKLVGAQFRWLNETLYTGTGGDAMALFKKKPAYFEAYHRGFRNSVKNWPANPLDYFIATLTGMVLSGDVRVVADFGCGEAKLAEALVECARYEDESEDEEDAPSGVVVHSFDLHASNERVTPCNMADVPLLGGAVDAAVFSLSLMGVNFVDYLHEAHRVLRPGCLLMIAEVASRFDENKGNSVKKFIKCMQRTFGFTCVQKDMTNAVFFIFIFRKQGGDPSLRNGTMEEEVEEEEEDDEEERADGSAQRAKKRVKKSAKAKANQEKKARALVVVKDKRACRETFGFRFKPCMYKKR